MVNDSPSPFTKDAYTPAPWWVPCLLSFLAGLAIPSAMLISNAATPDYQRGNAVGYATGWKEAENFFVHNNGKYKTGE